MKSLGMVDVQSGERRGVTRTVGRHEESGDGKSLSRSVSPGREGGILACRVVS